MSDINNEIIAENKYEDILNDEGFLNDLLTDFDATTKVEILRKAGIDVEAEWDKRAPKEEPEEMEVKVKVVPEQVARVGFNSEWQFKND